jgi:hypothetical protein
MTMSSDTNAYRVLASDGAVSPRFRWSDPGDTRDVAEVLEAEGISFDSEGRADPDPPIDVYRPTSSSRSSTRPRKRSSKMSQH